MKVLITVGTSLIDNIAKELIKKREGIRKKFSADVDELKRRYFQCELDEKLRKEIEGMMVYDLEKRSAEISTWKGFLQKIDSKINTDGEVIYVKPVVTEETSQLWEKAIAKEITNTKGVKVEIQSPEKLAGVREESEFRKSLNKLVSVIEEFCENPHEEKYLLISGGYKGFIPMITALGLLYPKTHIVYKHDASEEVLILHPLPVVVDFPRLDSVRSIIKMKELDRKVYDSLVNSYPFLAMFYDRDEGTGKPVKRTKVGDFFSEFYKKQRRLYGRGEYILDIIKDDNLKKAIKEKIPYWEYLWIGDQIPETVEHSRTHALRLLEYATHILSFFPSLIESLGDEGLAILYSAIWLHDFGHGILYLSGEFNKKIPYALLVGGIKEQLYFKTECKDINYLVAVNPDLVRKFHNVYTVEMLNKEFEFLLPEVKEDIKKAIKIACLYHRKKMPVSELSSADLEVCGVDSFEGIPLNSEKVAKLFEDATLFEKTKLAAALLSFVDGLDVQTDRMVSEEYRKVRGRRDEYEIEYHLRVLREYKDMICNFDKLESRLQELIKAWKSESFEDRKCLDHIIIKAVKKALAPNDEQRGTNEVEKADKLSEEKKNCGPSNEDLVWARETIQIPDAVYHLLRIVFISRQKEHFLKHSMVDTVVLSKEGSKELKVYLLPSTIGLENAELNEKLFKDIKEGIMCEYTLNEEVLEEYFTIKGVEVFKI